MDSKRKEELDAKWKAVATQAVTNNAFKNKLVTDPVSVMKENDLHLPEGVQAKVGTGQIVKLVASEGASEEVMAEVKWWEWRLDMIREFGREEESTEVRHVAPESDEGEI